MFRILCVPSSGSTEVYLPGILVVVHKYFVVLLVGVWQRNFEPVCVCVCVCTVRPPGSLTIHTHHSFKITLPNTDQAHEKMSVNHYEEFQSSTAL
jgi:hypothetical protein